MDMTDILAAFANEPLFPASEKFLKHLGVKFSTQINQQIDYINMNTPVAKEVPADEELKDLTPKK